MQLSIATSHLAPSAGAACITATQAPAAASRKTHAAQQHMQLLHIDTGSCSTAGNSAAAQLHMQLQHSNICSLQVSIAMQNFAGPSFKGHRCTQSLQLDTFCMGIAKKPHSMLATCSAWPPRAGLDPFAGQDTVHREMDLTPQGLHLTCMSAPHLPRHRLTWLVPTLKLLHLFCLSGSST